MKTDWTTVAKGSGQYADVNGIKLYYELPFSSSSRRAGQHRLRLSGGA
jgi:hypothetical protein